MTVWFKQGVIGDLRPKAQKGFGRVANLYASKGKSYFCTSIREGNHSYGSLHFRGDAWDAKRQGVSKLEIKEILGPDFDVVEYSDSRDIFHMEYDPK